LVEGTIPRHEHAVFAVGNRTDVVAFRLAGMSVVGQTRKSALATAMSAYLPLATIEQTSLEVRFVP